MWKVESVEDRWEGSGEELERSRVPRVRRWAYRGDTLYFTDQVFQDTLTGERFTAPDYLRGLPRRAIPVDLTGARVALTMKYQLPDPDLAAVVAADNQALTGITLTAATQGLFLVNIAATPNLQGLADGPVDLVFDFQVKDASNRVSTVEVGIYRILPDASRGS